MSDETREVDLTSEEADVLFGMVQGQINNLDTEHEMAYCDLLHRLREKLDPPNTVLTLDLYARDYKTLADALRFYARKLCEGVEHKSQAVYDAERMIRQVEEA